MEDLYAYELTNALSNGTNADPLRPPLPQDWGFATPKIQSLLFRESIFGWCIQPGPSEQKPIQSIGEKGAWAYPGTAQIFLDTPYYLTNG